MSVITEEPALRRTGKFTDTYKLTVRDYELDYQGVVNHATYLNYLEEARKCYLVQLGFNLKELLKRNIGFAMISYEINYIYPLVGGDEIVVETTMSRLTRLKFQFHQNVFLLPNRKPIAKASNVLIPIDNEKVRPQWFTELDPLMEGFLVPKTTLKIGNKLEDHSTETYP